MDKAQPSALDRLIDKKCFDVIYGALEGYIEDNIDSLELSSHCVQEPDGAQLIDMEVIRTNGGTSEDDTITFEVIVSCEIEIEETVRRNRETDSVMQWFRVRCKAELLEGLKNLKVTSVEVYSK
jgi:hypothetical protein